MNTESGAKRLRKLWVEGSPALGAWTGIASATTVELLCVPGVDYICIDQQHGVIDYDGMVDMLRAVEGRGGVALTRVPSNEAWMIGKSLDAGAQGVIVPLVNNAAEARRAVAACRYGSKGMRSYGPARAGMLMNSGDTAVLGDEVLCFVMVETRQGVDNVEEIAATPGLDGIYIGPVDLAIGLGLTPAVEKTEEIHVNAVARIRETCKKRGIISGIHCISGMSAAKRVNEGFGLVTFTKDTLLLQAGIKQELAMAKGSAGGVR
jgi:4-hydroxy-2-oxoheptanedioate aldolase